MNTLKDHCTLILPFRCLPYSLMDLLGWQCARHCDAEVEQNLLLPSRHTVATGERHQADNWQHPATPACDRTRKPGRRVGFQGTGRASVHPAEEGSRQRRQSDLGQKFTNLRQGGARNTLWKTRSGTRDTLRTWQHPLGSGMPPRHHTVYSSTQGQASRHTLVTSTCLGPSSDSNSFKVRDRSHDIFTATKETATGTL